MTRNPTYGDDSLEKVRKSFRHLLEGEEIPAEIRKELAKEFDDLRVMLDKLEQRELHVAALGRVGVGKSALLNALAGAKVFEVGVLFGVTKDWEARAWTPDDASGQLVAARLEGRLVLIDTPGFSEAGEAGQEREAISRAAAKRADLVLFVCDGDLTGPEVKLLHELADMHKPTLVALNKIDRLTDEERGEILDSIRSRWLGELGVDIDVVPVCAEPRPVVWEIEKPDGSVVTETRCPPAQVAVLKEHIWKKLEDAGLDLLAVNSALFASNLSDSVSERVAELRQKMAERVLAFYSTAKALAVALNPVPIADVLGGMAADAGMVMALARLHGMKMTWKAAEELSATIGKQMLLLVGTEILTHIAADVLKGLTLGLSTVVTALPQGLIAGYNSLVIGRAALVYLRQGFSWGPQGPKAVVKDILNRVDEKTVLAQMKTAIYEKLERRK